MDVSRISCNNLCVLPGAETAQLIERPVEKPGAIRMRVRVPGDARDFSPRVMASGADSLTVSVQPPCAITCLSVC